VLNGIAQDGDILLLLGAGSIGRVAELMDFEQGLSSEIGHCH